MVTIDVFPNSLSDRQKHAPESKFSFVNRFFHSSSIHGLHYIGNNEISLFGRFLWCCVIMGSLSFSLYLCQLMWKKWDESPVMITLDSHSESIFSQPFPAVTICNNNKGEKKAYLRYLNRANQSLNETLDIQFTEENIHNYFTIVSNVDSPLIDENMIEHLTKISKLFNFTIVGHENRIRQTRSHCLTFTRYISFKSIQLPSNVASAFLQHISEIPTDDGICCSFNYGGVGKSRETKVLKSSGHGLYMGLSVLLHADLKEYGVVNHGFNGFKKFKLQQLGDKCLRRVNQLIKNTCKVLIHDPDEFPEVDSRGFPLTIGSEIFAAVQVSRIQTSEAVMSLHDTGKRGCIVENFLQYFPRYSVSNCQMECQLLAMAKHCQCIPYYYTQLMSHVEIIKTCEVEDYLCLKHVRKEIRENMGTFCHCPPNCTELRYTITLAQANFPGVGFNYTAAGRALYQSEINRRGKWVLRYNRSELAMLNVYYDGQPGINYMRDIRYGWEDFVCMNKH